MLNIEFYGKNIEMTDSMKAYVANKAEKLSKYIINKDAELHVTAEVIREEQIATLTLDADGKVYSATSQSYDFYDAFLSSLDKIKNQLVNAKGKTLAKRVVHDPVCAIKNADDMPEEDIEGDAMCVFHFFNEKSGREEQFDLDIDSDDAGWLRKAWEKWQEFCCVMGLPEDCLRDVKVYGLEEVEVQGIAK